MKPFERKECNNFQYIVPNPEEMNEIIKYLERIGKINVKYSTLEILYSDFSEDKYSSGWMGVIGYKGSIDYDILDRFASWLEEKDFPLEQEQKQEKDSLKKWELFNLKKPTQNQCAKNDCRFIVSDGNRVYMALYDYIAYEFVKFDEPKLYDRTIIKWQELPEL